MKGAAFRRKTERFKETATKLMHSTLEKYNSLMRTRLPFHCLVLTYSKNTEQMGKYGALWFPRWRKWPLFVFHRTRNIYQGKTFPGSPVRGTTHMWLHKHSHPPPRQYTHAEAAARNNGKVINEHDQNRHLPPKYRADSKQLLSISLYAALPFLYT